MKATKILEILKHAHLICEPSAERIMLIGMVSDLVNETKPPSETGHPDKNGLCKANPEDFK